MSINLRSGIGYDIHKLVKGRKLVIGGLEIPYEKGLEGHSDADVLLHAVCDALLGAAGLEDIGTHFPNTDPQLKNIDSMKILKRTYEMIIKKGFIVLNIDSVIFAEAPNFSYYKKKMAENIARCIKIAKTSVNVKATTSEGLGFVGKGEGIAAMCNALLIKIKTNSVPIYI